MRLPALLAGALLCAACTEAPDPALVRALGDATAPALFAPEVDGDRPRSFLMNTFDNSVTLDYGDGFAPTLTLREAPAGDLCAGREAEYDRCRVLDEDAVRLSFEEMDAVVVRRDGTELLWSNLSFEMPDEEFDSEEELLAAIEAEVASYVSASRDADVLTAAELVDAVPTGRVGQP